MEGIFVVSIPAIVSGRPGDADSVTRDADVRHEADSDSISRSSELRIPVTSYQITRIAVSVRDYWEAVDVIVGALKRVDEVASILLCGSLAKGDVVPGWSDIDLVVFLGPGGGDLAVLTAIADHVQSAHADTPIRIGLDLVRYDEFQRSAQLGGRPLMMTYEVAHYGRLLHGEWPFGGLTFTPDAQARVERERAPLVRAELHSWRQRWCWRSHQSRAQPDWLFETTKILLRILQVLTGPNLDESPIGIRVSLDRLRTLHPDHPLLLAMERAVEIRASWQASKWTRCDRERHIDLMSRALHAFEL